MHLCRLGLWVLGKKKVSRECVYMFVCWCVCERERGQEREAGKEHISLCALTGGLGGGLLYLTMARLLTLFITIPPRQRPTMGYYHLASVNTSYAVELWTSESRSWLLDASAVSAREGKNLSCLCGQFYWFTESFSNTSRDSCDLSAAALFVPSLALCLRSEDIHSLSVSCSTFWAC